jgi:hypothetical protein
LISTDKIAEASSIESQGTPANVIDDNNPATRWSSKFSDPQWVKLDLGRTASIHKVVLQWENPPTPRHTSSVADRGDAWSSNASTRPTRSGGSSGSDLDRQGLGEVQVNLRCRANVWRTERCWQGHRAVRLRRDEPTHER